MICNRLQRFSNNVAKLVVLLVAVTGYLLDVTKFTKRWTGLHFTAFALDVLSACAVLVILHRNAS